MNDVLSDKDLNDDLIAAQRNSMINAQIQSDANGMNSDEDGSPSKGGLQIPEYYDNQQFAMSTKKNCESSLNVVTGKNMEGAQL